MTVDISLRTGTGPVVWALTERKTVLATEAPAIPSTVPLERKAAIAVPAPAPDSAIVGIDEDEGLVTAIVSVTGVLDEVGDVIMPGAYEATLRKRKPKGIWHHADEVWTARTEEATELLPGDERLPVETKDGKPWPEQAGALLVKAKFNLETQAGKEAFSNVKFFGPDCEWSIGYHVPAGKAVKRGGIRYIKGLELYEYSPVLFGANPAAGTLNIKSAAPGTPIGEIPEGDDDSAEGDVDGEGEATSAGDPADDTGEGDQDGEGDEGGQDDEDTTADGTADELTADELTAEIADVDWTAVAFALADEDDLLSEDLLAEAKDNPAAGREHKYDTTPVGTPGGKPNWVDKAGGLPPFIRAVAHALIRQGKDKSKAIQIAIGQIRNWAEGKGGVSAKVKAKAAAAIAAWEKMQAGTGKKETAKPLEVKMYPYLAGSQEERAEMLRGAVNEALRGAATLASNGQTRYEWDWVSIDATFDDHVIATRRKWSDVDDGPASKECYRIDYRWDEERNGIVLGDAQAVELRVVATPAGGEVKSAAAALSSTPYDASAAAVTDAIGHATTGVGFMVMAEAETKAGKVLSGANANRIKGAYDTLGDVLRKAGVLAAAATDKPDTPGGAPTTSAETKDDGVVRSHLDPATLVASFRAFADSVDDEV